ncbi:MAG: hypothetical protein A2X46_17400 [Lentisphaerae bacterium GWF2_57_35]|nr:MAG: hypothetical protein A2X46_17400 [Lentisphaerae bacterium GWF2_57_35]
MSNARAFTFVEVLVALVMCSIMVSAICTALIVALKAEQMASWLREAERMNSEVAAHYYRGESPTNLLSRASGDWSITEEFIRQKSDETTLVWKVWNLMPNDRPSLNIRLCLHELARTNGL